MPVITCSRDVTVHDSSPDALVPSKEQAKLWDVQPHFNLSFAVPPIPEGTHGVSAQGRFKFEGTATVDNDGQIRVTGTRLVDGDSGYF